MKKVMGLACGFAVLALVWPASAQLITKNGGAVFSSSGFETDTVGASPTVGVPGSWVINTVDDNTDPLFPGVPAITVLGPASAGPGARQGQQYASLYKDVGDVAQGIAMFGSTATAGDVVSATFDLYVSGREATGAPRTGGDGNHVQINFTKNSSGGFPNRQNWFGLAFPGGDIAGLVSTAGLGPDQLVAVEYDGAWRNVTVGGSPLFVAADKWVNLSLNLTVDASYTVSVDGVTSDPVGIQPDAMGGSVAGLEIRANVGNRDSLFYIDSVPEPASISLLALGGLGLLARRRAA